jgi:hypothetical protein
LITVSNERLPQFPRIYGDIFYRAIAKHTQKAAGLTPTHKGDGVQGLLFHSELVIAGRVTFIESRKREGVAEGYQLAGGADFHDAFLEEGQLPERVSAAPAAPRRR